MKKNIIALFLLFALAGCGRESVPMDQLSADGKYHYKNEELGFAVVFPPEFIYYQTQRNNLGNFVDMEYFVPTGDREFLQTVPGYGRAVIIRVIDKADYSAELADETDIVGFIKAGESKSRFYFIDFWRTPPADWTDKWSEEIKKEIEDSFEIL